MNGLPRYVFIGHGWDLNKEISISGKNANIAMLSTPTCLFEDPTFKHMKLLAGAKNPEQYTEALLTYGKQYRNDFCMYSSNSHPRTPELLLTTFTKGSELSRLVKVGEIRGTDVPTVFLLSEIVDKLHAKHPEGFFLIVYTCRSPLTDFQIENIGVFGEVNGQNIINYINQRSIHISSEEEEKINLPCKSL